MPVDVEDGHPAYRILLARLVAAHVRRAKDPFDGPVPALELPRTKSILKSGHEMKTLLAKARIWSVPLNTRA
jgi:hypothetical protein